MNRAAVAAFAITAATVSKDLWGETVSIAGVEYTAAVGLPPFEGRLESGGESFSGQILIAILKTDLASAPALNTELSARGRKWIIDRITGDGIMAAWNLRCTPKN
jgi:hypothetical protein